MLNISNEFLSSSINLHKVKTILTLSLYFYLLKSILLIIHIKLLVEINYFLRERQFSLLTSGFV